MRRRAFLQAVAGATGAVLLGGCSGTGGPGAGGRPTVRVVSWTSLGYPSPFTYTGGPGFWRMSLLFDTLTWPDSTGEQLPWLASRYERGEDGMSYTVELRNGLTWDDGRPVTPRDVAFTFEYYTSQTFTPLLIGLPRNVADVVPTGERTVEFRLARPDATFLQQVLGTVPIVPEHIWSPNSNPMAAEGPEALIGTGAYRLDARNEVQDRESYVANDDYFLGRPFVGRIEMLPAENPLTSLAAGELDGAASAVEGVRNEVLDPFRDNPEFGLIDNQAGFGFPLFFNMTRGGALADLRFRRACLHALNRPDMVNRLLTGNGQVGSQGFLPPTHPYYNPEVRTYPFDPSEAERLLDEAGYRRSGPGGARTNADGSPLRYQLYIPDAIPIALAELTAANLRGVGVEVDLEVVDLVRLFGIKSSETYDMLITSYPGPSGVGPNGDPEILRGIYHSDPPSDFHKATGYANPEVDRLLDAQLGTYDVEERTRLVGEIQEIVAEDLPVAMLYYTTMFYAYRRSVFDQWYFTPGGFGPGIPEAYNKHAYITGRQVGTEVRAVDEA